MSDYVFGSPNLGRETLDPNHDQSAKDLPITPKQDGSLSSEESLHDLQSTGPISAQKSLDNELPPKENTSVPQEILTLNDDFPNTKANQDIFAGVKEDKLAVASEEDDQPNFTSSLHADQSIFAKVIKNGPASVNESTQKQTSVKFPSHTKQVHFSSAIFLFLRQLLASFFTHTNLGVLFSKIAANLGPCYPSSMPIPYFALGFLSTLPFFYGLNFLMQVPHLLSGALSVTAFFIIGGICGFRGIAKMCASFSSSRYDHELQSVVSALYVILLTACLETMHEMLGSDMRQALFFGTCCMLSALSACSLSIGLTADPVDSFGSLSLKGLLFASVITVATVYASYPPLAATSLIGIALFLRLLLGALMHSRALLISRAVVCGTQLLILPVLLFYTIIASGRGLL